MLRITQIESGPTVQTLKLEGKLVGPWVEELARFSRQSILNQTQPDLDLSAVAFVDGAGLELLREMLSKGARLTACSGLVAELLGREKR
jgi:ABC-type transporter Mla MlaB component